MHVADHYLLPTSLWLVMYSIGLGLITGDFQKILSSSRAFVLGAGSMILLVPIAGTLLSVSFAPTAALEVGLILLATCPSGILSNLLTDIAKGDVALSVSITLFVSVVYVFTLPFIAHYALTFVYGNAEALSIPLGSSIAHIIFITAVPVSVGMLVRRWLPVLAATAGVYIKSVATTVLVIVFGMIVVQQFDTLRASFGTIMAIVVTMNATNLAVAFAVARLGRVARRQRTAIIMEHLIRQEATAIYVAVALLHRNDMSIPMIINTFIGMGLSVAFVLFLRRVNTATTA